MQQQIFTIPVVKEPKVKPSCRICRYYDKDSKRCKYNGGYIPDWVTSCDRFERTFSVELREGEYLEIL